MTKIFSDTFLRQTKLLLEILPFIKRESCFTLKGGTAINFFVQNMPRLSVDIDLNYQLIEPRDATLKNMNAALTSIKSDIENNLKDVHASRDMSEMSRLSKLIIYRNNVAVKVEINPVFRGSVFQPEVKKLCQPEWEKLPFNHLKTLPALQWKTLNVRQMTKIRRDKYINAVKNCFS